jgi:hypothetical protein
MPTGVYKPKTGSQVADAVDAVAALSVSEAAALDGVTAGTITASKAAVVDSNKDIGDFRNLGAVNVDAGASGTAGSVDVFPTTASKGKLSITAADSTGNTTTTIVNAEQAGARTYTIPDAGASASFLMTEGDQTLGDGKDIAVGTTTGTKIGTATSQKLGFWNATPVVQPSAYTQTYATADKTHSNPTAAALTVADGAGTNDGTIGAITDNASTIAAVQELAAQINKLVTDLADVKQLVNSVIDDLQAVGVVG